MRNTSSQHRRFSARRRQQQHQQQQQHRGWLVSFVNDVDDGVDLERYQRLEAVIMDEFDNNSRNSRWGRLLDDSELCIVCKSYTASGAVCSSCYELHSQNYKVWKAWIEREQMEYQSQMGCTYMNLTWNSVFIQRRGVVTPELFLLKRIKACIGWAIHGLIFEFLDGTRTGYVVDVHSIDDDESIDKRRSTDWFDIPMGDHIRTVRGFNLSRGCFLCHTLQLDFASGRTISFESAHDPWKGDAFQYDIPEYALVHHISFREGKCRGVAAAESIMHLRVKCPQRVKSLSRNQRQTFRLIQLVANRIDRNRIEAGERPLGRDLWHTIICDYLACYDLQPFKSSTIGRLQRRQEKGQKIKDE